MGGQWGSVNGMMGGGDREKVGSLGEGELRMIFIHEEGRREKMEGLLVT